MTEPNMQEILRERFAQLPSPVQKAIFSEDVSKNLRSLSERHKLHLDQWEKLENAVMLTLFGVTPIDELQGNIQKELAISSVLASELSVDISRIVFEPIRQELERNLEHPEAKEKEVSEIEAARTSALSDQKEIAPAPQIVDTQEQTSAPLPSEKENPSPAPKTQVPESTPSAPVEKAIRMPASGSYKPGEASSARKDIHDDPYREPPA